MEINAAPLQALVERLSPGARLVRSRRLRGGISSRMHVLDIVRADGSRWKVSLRRAISGHYLAAPAEVAREFAVLDLLDQAGIAAPRPLLLDSDGDFFGVPALVLSYLPGRPLLGHRKPGVMMNGLAAALIAVHQAQPSSRNLKTLPVASRDAMRAAIDRWLQQPPSEPLMSEVLAALDGGLSRVELATPTLVHNDFWRGNVVWHRGKVTGVIDWSEAGLGDPRMDIAECSLDLALTDGIAAADAFRDAYERQAPASAGLAPAHGLPDIWFFDLYRGVRALREYEEWLAGYAGLGGVVEAVPAGRRLRVFLRRALAESNRN